MEGSDCPPFPSPKTTPYLNDLSPNVLAKRKGTNYTTPYQKDPLSNDPSPNERLIIERPTLNNPLTKELTKMTLYKKDPSSNSPFPNDSLPKNRLKDPHGSPFLKHDPLILIYLYICSYFCPKILTF